MSIQAICVKRTTSTIATLACAALLASSGSLAADPDDRILPGLWEIEMSSDIGDLLAGQLAELEKEMASMSEELREQMKAMLAEQMHTDPEIELICLTAADVADGVMALLEDNGIEEDCEQTLRWLGKGRGEITIRCAGGIDTDGELLVSSPREVTLTSVTSQSGKAQGSFNWQARWKAEDCGDVE